MRAWKATDFARHGAPILIELGISDPLEWCGRATVIGELISDKIVSFTATGIHTLSGWARSFVLEIVAAPLGARDPGALCVACCRAAAVKVLFDIVDVAEDAAYLPRLSRRAPRTHDQADPPRAPEMGGGPS